MGKITAEALLQQLRDTVQKLEQDGASIPDLKIAAGALREMQEGFKLFAPFRHVRKVSTFGSARVQEGDPVFQLAEEFARRIADRGFMVITGAGGGIMEACQRGAGRDRSFGVNIRLPHEQRANSIIRGDPKLMSFRYFFTRKLFFLKEADAVVLFPGGFGTHDEAFETLTLLQTGKTRPVPLVFLDRKYGTYWSTWQRYVEEHMLRRGMIDRTDFALFRVTDDLDEAVDEILRFYEVFHSIRYVREMLVIRIQRRLPDGYVEQLDHQFRDIIVHGRLVQRSLLPVERDEPEIASLPRLVLHFDRMHYGRLRQLIDAINRAPQEQSGGGAGS